MGHFRRDARKTGGGYQSAENSKPGAKIPSPWYVFGRLERGLQVNQLNFIENHIGSYELFERMMGFQYFINNTVTQSLEVMSNLPNLE